MSWWKQRDEMREESLAFAIPAWLSEFEKTLPRKLRGDDEAMGYAIALSAVNVKEGSGGPFGAVIVDAATGEVLSVGANLVLSAKLSVLHAEIVAILRAQKKLESYSLGGQGRSATLYTSAEPCAMCMGAIPWSGIGRVVCAASDEDVRAIGYDEGDKPGNWQAAYERRGIKVTCDFMREPAVKVMRDYAAKGGVIY